LIELGEEKLQS